MFLVTAVLSLMLSGCLPIPAGDLMPACPGGLEPAALSHPSPQMKTKANWLVNGKMLPTLVDKSTNSSGLGWRSCFTSESVLQGFAVGGAGGSGGCCGQREVLGAAGGAGNSGRRWGQRGALGAAGGAAGCRGH